MSLHAPFCLKPLVNRCHFNCCHNEDQLKIFSTDQTKIKQLGIVAILSSFFFLLQKLKKEQHKSKPKKPKDSYNLVKETPLTSANSNVLNLEGGCERILKPSPKSTPIFTKKSAQWLPSLKV